VSRRNDELEDQVFNLREINSKIKAERAQATEDLAYSRIVNENSLKEINRLAEANIKLSEVRPVIQDARVDPFESERAVLAKQIETLKADNDRLRKEVLVDAIVAADAKKWHHIEIG